MTDTCVYCGCPTNTHDCTGCLTEGCPCGYDGDWHVGEPDRPDPWEATHANQD